MNLKTELEKMEIRWRNTAHELAANGQHDAARTQSADVKEIAELLLWWRTRDGRWGDWEMILAETVRNLLAQPGNRFAIADAEYTLKCYDEQTKAVRG